MRRRVRNNLELERPYFHGPWPDCLPTFRDWILLLLVAAILAGAFKQYIYLGMKAGWRVAVWQFATEAFREIKEAWSQ